MRKKRNVFRTIAVMLMIMTSLIWNLPVYAAEQLENDILKITQNSLSNSTLNNSVKSDAENLPIFLQAVMEDGEVVGAMHCFYLADESGDTYLVSSVMTSASAESGADLSILVDGELEELEYLGYDNDYLFAYLDYKKLDGYQPIEVKDEFDKDDLFILVVDGIQGENLSFLEVTIPEGSLEKQGDHYSMGIQVDGDSYIYLGAPVFNESSEELVGFMDIDLETKELICRNISEISLDEAFAIGYAGGEIPVSEEPIYEEPETTETSQQPQAEEAPVEEAPAEEAPSEEAPSEEPETQGTGSAGGVLSTIPGWAYGAIVVLVIGAIYVSNNQKKKDKKDSKPENQVENAEYPKEGTIALNKMESQPSEGTVVSEPPKAKWQIRGMGGTFDGNTFALTDTLRFGRNPQNQVVYPQNTKGISGNHCELSMENGRIILRDLGSTYGTFLGNGSKLNERVACEVKEGDIFYLAESAQSFRIEQVGESRQVFTPAVKATMYPKAGETYRADAGGKLQFGRSTHCQVSFGGNDTKISTSHCVLYRENGVLYLKDLGSTNGTFFAENRRLQPNVAYQVEKGTSFYLTSQNYMFVITED